MWTMLFPAQGKSSDEQWGSSSKDSGLGTSPAIGAEADFFNDGELAD